MEEVDKIIIQTLKAIGIKFDDKISRIKDFSQELFVECVAKLLNTINPSENLPSQLPPNTGIKYRICTKFATLCQDLGYKSEIGYQTFLYSNETDVRRLLMFLIEKLPKDTSQQEDEGVKKKSKEKNISLLISEKINFMLQQCWMPHYCKQKGLRVIDNNLILNEGCKNIKKFHGISLAMPVNYLNGKSKYSKDSQEYYEKFCSYVTNQVKNESIDLLSSLMKYNTIERIKEQELLNMDLESRKAKSEKFYGDLKTKIKEEMSKYNASNNNSNCLKPSDMLDIENDLENRNFANLKAYLNKGSRFTLIENLQYSKDESETSVALPSTNSEEKKQEEIKQLKETLEGLNKDFDDLDETMRKISKEIERTNKECEEQKEINKKLEENYALKRKTFNLIQDAPKNLARLKDEIENFEQKMKTLEQQWLEHKKPLDDEKEKLNEMLALRKQELDEKLNEIKQLKDELKKLNNELAYKDDDVKELTKNLENVSKEKSNTNRQFYTKRILEIMTNIEKQKREIEKTLIETKSIQKEINQLTGKLERIFNETDELVFKDAKKDESNKKAYKLFISINENYEQLIKTIEETSVIRREICDLEDQVDSETQNNVTANMDSLINDYKQIKEENEQLVKKLKAASKK